MAMNVRIASTVHEFKMKTIDGQEQSLSDYNGKVLLIVNVASECGYTPQYEGLQKLYEKYHDRGLVVMGFPANNFGAQEPGTDAQIKTFCSTKYHVTFPMFSKISVLGADIHPLYAYLTSQHNDSAPAGDVHWNFEKFLVGKDGKVIQRFKHRVPPDDPELIKAIENALK